jgi:hypothetical protein
MVYTTNRSLRRGGGTQVNSPESGQTTNGFTIETRLSKGGSQPNREITTKMKLEEMNEINTILIEATDERSAVMNQVSKQTKPVIIVLPEQADQIFRQPGDFFELKRVKRERGISISFVISGHERIRNMARRQGFQVYTSAETCVKAMARRDRLYSMRGISLSGTTGNLDQTRFIVQGEESDEDTPWSYDVRMQQATTPSASFTAQGDDGDEDTPWSYDVRMQQVASTAATPKLTRELSNSDVPPWSYDVQMQHTPSMQSGDEAGDDTPWSYDVQMNQKETPTEQQHPQRTAWMLAEEELWNQNHHQPTQRDQYTPSSYVGAPAKGALSGASASRMGGPISLGGNAASLGETPVSPYFTETLQNLIALSGEKMGTGYAPGGYPQGMPVPYTRNSHNSGVLDPDEIPTQPGNAHPSMGRASLTGALPTGAQTVRYAPETEPLFPLLETRPLTDSEHSGSRIALMLTALLVLGILGGVCCGYVLTLMHVNLTVLTSTISSL